MAPPIGVNGWSFRGFADTGAAWNDSSDEKSFYTGVGLEAVLDGTLGYYLGLRVRIGAAKGLGSEGEETIYMELGGSF
jgi:outer membrane translocation and assembly module TamA